MALIREVLNDKYTGKWAYVEYSDEDKNHQVILGGKEFDTEDEAKEWSKGFALRNYEHVNPCLVKSDNQSTKPHISVMPKDVWIGKRLVELKTAIKSCLDEKSFDCIPTEWVVEHNSLIEQLRNEYNPS